MTDIATAPSSTVAIIGGGVMGGAIAAGVRNGGWSAESVTVADKSTETLADLAAAHELMTTTSLAEAAAGADVIVFAVKPQDAAEVLAEFGPHVKPGSMLLTVAAGLPASFYEARLPAGTPVVRAMPNTPALVGFGATAIAAGASATDAHLAVAARVLAATGLVVTVDEGDINAVSTVSGSGPAYFYAFVEAMIEAGITQGLDRDVAEALAKQTLIGAGRLLESSGATPGELRARVSSKGGTTLAALEAMSHAGLQTTVAVGLAAADRRARELAVELSGD
ncbi:pyrroline-5-carboxylate reductase [Demequina sp. TTPB684]|uniref:pyrroline-5-carboxylate reductase n=1 Tax=unclassified Demequina TaxID=2620311 RepID=UPI001CF1C50E|nr:MULTISPECIES: pyrroline-5-carboxylate reductase [unclassified Demequina]MCB2413243.1 pyrroline-5-carboxylate reductase [Demequina sp. TTPB684]UPU88183.1 pyrroline-5-carboxylate reductase [Demequina sp. TMPB413]